MFSRATRFLRTGNIAKTIRITARYESVDETSPWNRGLPSYIVAHDKSVFETRSIISEKELRDCKYIYRGITVSNVTPISI